MNSAPASSVPNATITIQTCEKEFCIVCNGEGELVYTNLTDRLFNVPGRWSMRRCKDNSCGTQWLDPAPSPEDLWKLYVNYYTHQDVSQKSGDAGFRKIIQQIYDDYLSRKFGYAPNLSLSLPERLMANALKLMPERRANLDFSVFYLPAQNDARLLEIGCGSGNMLLNMKKRGWQVKGLDFDPIAVKNAQTKGLDVSLGDIFQQKFADNAFDAIVISHVIEHVPDPLALLQECARITGKGGCVVVITPNVIGALSLLYKQNFLHLDPPRHLNLFTPNSLAKLASKASFSSVNVNTTIRDISNLYAACENLAKKGAHEMQNNPRSMNSLIKGYFLSLKRNKQLKINRFSGDEIVLKLER